MKKILNILTLSLTLLVVACGPSDSDIINTVKNGTFSLDQTRSLSDVFNSLENVTKVTWSTSKSSTGADFVVAKCFYENNSRESYLTRTRNKSNIYYTFLVDDSGFEFISYSVEYDEDIIRKEAKNPEHFKGGNKSTDANYLNTMIKKLYEGEAFLF